MTRRALTDLGRGILAEEGTAADGAAAHEQTLMASLYHSALPVAWSGRTLSLQEKERIERRTQSAAAGAGRGVDPAWSSLCHGPSGGRRDDIEGRERCGYSGGLRADSCGRSGP